MLKPFSPHKRDWSLFLRRRLQTTAVPSLFDPAFYRRFNRLPGLSDRECLRHFAEIGSAEGLRPHPLFDPEFYRAACGDSRLSDPLAHYNEIGWRKGLRPNAYFDPAFYLASNPDVRLAGFEPLEHYASRGWREGRETAAEFNPSTYRHHHPELSADCDPLADLLFRLRRREDVDLSLYSAPVPCRAEEPTAAQWAALPQPAGEAEIDVIVPVYAGRGETLRTLYSVLAARRRRSIELVVINDASPDPGIASALNALAARGLINLLVNERNCGFVASCNRGMRLHPHRDVVLLNADTEVFDGWLDRLRGAVEDRSENATATPWSNAATILSYPIRLRDNHAPLETEAARLDLLAAALDGSPQEIPTGIGFCMYVKRRCLDEIGPFDETRFGRGYGEENDLCRRAIKRGWRNVAATNLFVYHHAARSFGAEKSARIDRALETVERLHPGYLSSVHRFISRDPLQPVRLRFDLARLRDASPENILVLGNAEASADAEPGVGVIRFAADVGPLRGSFRLESTRVPITPNLSAFDPRSRRTDLLQLITGLGVVAVRITEDLAALPVGRLLASLADAAGIPRQTVPTG